MTIHSARAKIFTAFICNFIIYKKKKLTIHLHKMIMIYGRKYFKLMKMKKMNRIRIVIKEYIDF